MIEVPKHEYKYLIGQLDSLKLQITFQTMIGPKTRTPRPRLDEDDVTLIALLKMQNRPVAIHELCQKAFPEIYHDEDTGRVSEHIRFQQIRNKVNKLVTRGFIRKVENPVNKRVKMIDVSGVFNLVVPEKSMIVYKLFTPHAPDQAQTTVSADR